MPAQESGARCWGQNGQLVPYPSPAWAWVTQGPTCSVSLAPPHLGGEEGGLPTEPAWHLPPPSTCVQYRTCQWGAPLWLSVCVPHGPLWQGCSAGSMGPCTQRVRALGLNSASGLQWLSGCLFQGTVLGLAAPSGRPPILRTLTVNRRKVLCGRAWALPPARQLLLGLRRRGLTLDLRPSLLRLQVREILGRCTCPDQFPMIKVSEGKYRVGDSSLLIFVRVSGGGKAGCSRPGVG